MAATLQESLEAWLEHDHFLMGQILVRRREGAWELLHQDDADKSVGELTIYYQPEKARDLAKYDEAGEFRPLKSAPNLRRGWLLRLKTGPDVHVALNYFHPAALANWTRHQVGQVVPVPLRETLNRQTGMYRITGLLEPAEAERLIAEACHPSKCARKILWSLEPASAPVHQPAPPPPHTIPLLCCEACNLVVAAARTVIKSRPKPAAS